MGELLFCNVFGEHFDRLLVQMNPLLLSSLRLRDVNYTVSRSTHQKTQPICLLGTLCQ
jgi:hypothetical protein